MSEYGVLIFMGAFLVLVILTLIQAGVDDDDDDD